MSKSHKTIKEYKKFTNYNVFRSFNYAFSGLKIAFIREKNIRIQFFLGLFLTLLGIAAGRHIAAMANFILMGVVISLEIINTAIENLCDFVHPEESESIKVIKDLTAGSVLILALVWMVVIVYLLAVVFNFNLSFANM
jgi:diacylglycerol kinase